MNGVRGGLGCRSSNHSSFWSLEEECNRGLQVQIPEPFLIQEPGGGRREVQEVGTVGLYRRLVQEVGTGRLGTGRLIELIGSELRTGR